ncbi:Holliday junction resolvase RuvX [Kiloniella sp.]|uniref:Holliday junction resolvase RuvX n=1 Tax=Kiloniella sp. TaxID=1938587 RepID=UPI003B01CB6B
MQDLDIHDLPDILDRNQRLLGLDPGTKTIGMAVSDRDFTVASPIGTIKRTKFKKDAEELKAICLDRNIGGIVMGLPVNMDGTEGPRCQSVRTLAENLQAIANIDLPIVFWDERMSTSAVERFLIGEADMTRKRRAEVVDKAAAAYILQGALDAIQRQLKY